jgi:hypothetical protein
VDVANESLLSFAGNVTIKQHVLHVLFVVNFLIGNLEPKEKRKLKGNLITFDLLNFYIKNIFI